METTNMVAIFSVAIVIVKSIQSADIIKTRQRSRPTNIASMVNNLVQNDLFYVDATAFEHGISMLHSVRTIFSGQYLKVQIVKWRSFFYLFHSLKKIGN